LEYDFVVAPGANPSQIRMAFKGMNGLQVNGKGQLVLKTDGGDLVQKKPLIYQEINGVRKEVAGSYVMHGKDQVGFRVANYDASKPLVIDPVLVYSTYIGGNDRDIIYSSHVDA